MNKAAFKKWDTNPAQVSAETAAAALNAPQAKTRPVPTYQIRDYLMRQGVWPTLAVAAANPANAAACGLAATTLDYLTSAQTIDLGDAKAQAMLAGLQAAGLLTGDQAAAIRALATYTLPLGVVLGVLAPGETLTAAQVTAWRQ